MNLKNPKPCMFFLQVFRRHLYMICYIIVKTSVFVCFRALMPAISRESLPALIREMTSDQRSADEL